MPDIPPPNPAAPTVLPPADLLASITGAINQGFTNFATQFRAPAAPPSTPAPTPATPAAPAPNDATAARVDVLEKELADARNRENTTLRNAALDAAFAAATKDFSPVQIRALRATLEQDHGKHITVVDGKVIYDTPQTGKLDVTKFVADTFLKSDIALGLKPAPILPGGKELAPNTTATNPIATSAHKWAGKSFPEVRKLAGGDPAAFNDLRQNHPEEFAAVLKRK